jgi:hypothetical protein
VSNAFYARLAGTASRLLSKFGATVSVSRSVGRIINPVTGAITPGSVTTLTAKGIVQRYSDGLIDDTRIKDSDRLLILDNSFEPLLTDRPQVDGQQWNIVDIKSVKPAALTVVYFVQVRR